MTETFFDIVNYAYQKDTLVRDVPPPVDDDGFYYSRLIPGDRVEDHLCADVFYDSVDDTLRCVECDQPI